MNRIKFLAATVAALTLPLIGLTAASASTAKPPPAPKLATIACQVTTPGCNEPVFAQAPVSSLDFTPSADAAMTKVGSSLQGNQNNSLDDGSQDFTFDLASVVPTFFGDGGYGLTAFDRFHYHGDGIYQEEWTPFGFDSGYCVQDQAITHRLILSACDGGRDQAWIVTRHIPFVNPPAALNYTFALSVLQAVNAQHHRCLTGTTSGFGQLTDSRCVNHSPGAATDQMWSALP